MTDYRCGKCGGDTFVVCTNRDLNKNGAPIEAWCEDAGCTSSPVQSNSLAEAFAAIARELALRDAVVEAARKTILRHLPASTRQGV
jgi:hypothetical protein